MVGRVPCGFFPFANGAATNPTALYRHSAPFISGRGPTLYFKQKPQSNDPPKVIAVHWLFWNGILIMDDDHPQYIKDTAQPGTTPRKHQPTTPSVVPDVHAFLGIRSQRHLLPLLQQIVTSGTAGPQGFKSYQASAMNYFALDALTAKRANPVDALNPTYH